MNVAVFCSSSNRIAQQYRELAFELGVQLAKVGNVLVYGGATGGLMDAVAMGAGSLQGEIIGVIPDAVIRMNRQSKLPTSLHIVDSMSDRKALMKKFADVFVVLPGSYGTLDEMMDIVAGGIVGEHKKPLILLNQDGFYDLLIQQIERMRAEMFMPAEEKYKPIVCTDLSNCLDIINSLGTNS